MKNTSILYLMLFLSVSVSCTRQMVVEETEKWAVYEIVLSGPSEGNPYMDVELRAEFMYGKEKIRVPGFYDGLGTYRVRFSPPETGIWTYKTSSNEPLLDGQSGSFECQPPTGNNHGPLEIVNTYCLQHADGTSFYSTGTTAYQWTSVKQSIQEKTVETLASAPFNKIRMCVFPKTYRYGNDTEPWQHPFSRSKSESDYTQPNYEFFQNFDKRIRELLEQGIQADVILFHPYDEEWGYYTMGDQMNERYVRYMIARISAYRNVWWSLANEWDIPGIKEAIDWEGIGSLLQEEDPHQRLRGIHNWYDSEEHFYDHSRPWITHSSIQSSQFYNIQRWRDKYQKPVLFDEMRYEGDVPSGWGNLSGMEMASYFWMAGLSGAYPTHGETLQNDSDDSTEVRWWAKGGHLMGESVKPIGYFRQIMEEAPVNEMLPGFVVHGDSANRNNNIHLLAKEGTYYLAYVADSGQAIILDLPGESDYHLDIIDTWNMKIIESRAVAPGPFEYPTTIPYTALRLVR